jgi:hypothetical protein
MPSATPKMEVELRRHVLTPHIDGVNEDDDDDDKDGDDDNDDPDDELTLLSAATRKDEDDKYLSLTSWRV